MTPNMIQQTLSEAFPDANITVDGDGRHFYATLISDQFTGKLPLARHRMVYAALGDLMDEAIHALSIQAFTPSEHNNT